MTNSICANEQIFNLIQSRRTCYQFLDVNQYPVDTQQLQICLQAATYAPNHKLTQPWRFWVLGEEYKKELSHIYADNRASKKQANTEDDCYQCFYDLAVEKFKKIPKIVLVGQELATNAIVEKEDYAACACAIQNFQLMAWQQQIGVQWSTGPILQDPRTYKLLNIDSEAVSLIGALYVGNIEENCQPKMSKNRKPIEEVTKFTL